ncbi:LytR family transcriptional regulator [Pradoshia sp. D12]|uniref:polyisoprenyl-teichoic acid--peptidoglycan teichoic acid transferase TagU n=1 Tax=Bacillaceae TaxID=186817 RepID=UPI00112978D7|nr:MULTISPECIES: LytR family transcriptional regulator [Bacillaceae]QFK72909.1 LytR family transcriptional regulator [Pradoshia sp. D12]TPF71901.1 LytR family transcriptional regulator [Bacillus sp. D12]
MRTDRTKKKKMKTWKKIVLGIIGLFVLVGSVFAFTVYRSFDNALDAMHDPIDRDGSKKRVEKVSLKDKTPFSVLLLGVDEREGDKGRSDTMIVLTVNPILESVKMVSIPRDTRTEIIGKGVDDKINHAFAFGGVEMSMDTVENLLDIPIDYYAQVNMEGFKDIVDAVGGVTVVNDLDFTADGHHFAEGTLNLNGEKALAYSRMRYEDPRGDFGRQMRQRQVIQAVLNKGASLSSLTRFDGIFEALGDNVKTDISFSQMVSIQQNYKEAAKSLEQLQLEGQGTKINKIYYYIPSDESLTNLQDTLKKHLQINK